MAIDTSFDFRSDAFGRDPDAHSATLRRYHQLLWSKPLPSGAMFDLSIDTPGVYLHHRSALGEFSLTSDSAVPSFTKWLRMKPIIGQLNESDNEAFRTSGCTIGAMVVWPGNRIDRKHTINQHRGFDSRIKDRLDLTLECVRRHYLCWESPLAGTLMRYRDFFALFENFKGYVDFFHLQDMVTGDQAAVRFLMPFNDFTGTAVPRDVESYWLYRRQAMEFIAARNRRIDALAMC